MTSRQELYFLALRKNDRSFFAQYKKLLRGDRIRIITILAQEENSSRLRRVMMVEDNIVIRKQAESYVQKTLAQPPT